MKTNPSEGWRKSINFQLILFQYQTKFQNETGIISFESN